MPRSQCWTRPSRGQSACTTVCPKKAASACPKNFASKLQGRSQEPSQGHEGNRHAAANLTDHCGLVVGDDVGHSLAWANGLRAHCRSRCGYCRLPWPWHESSSSNTRKLQALCNRAPVRDPRHVDFRLDPAFLSLPSKASRTSRARLHRNQQSSDSDTILSGV